MKRVFGWKRIFGCIILFIICVVSFTFLLVSCAGLAKKERVYEITYEVVYPDKTIEYTDTISRKIMVSDPDTIWVSSRRGTNYINICSSICTGFSSTSPIRLNSYKRIK